MGTWSHSGQTANAGRVMCGSLTSGGVFIDWTEDKLLIFGSLSNNSGTDINSLHNVWGSAGPS